MLTVEKTKELFRYDGVTGHLFWREFRNGVNSGKPAGYESSNGRKSYWKIRVDGKNYRAHRLVWIVCKGEIPSLEIDHINGDSLDNRIENLRLVTRNENAQNQMRSRLPESGVCGVRWCKRRSKWVAIVQHNNRRYFVGRFTKVEEAAAAISRVRENLGFHKNHGKLRGGC